MLHVQNKEYERLAGNEVRGLSPQDVIYIFLDSKCYLNLLLKEYAKRYYSLGCAWKVL